MLQSVSIVHGLVGVKLKLERRGNVNNIAMTRVDARLVHGQVAARWSRTLHANKIIVIDDSVANDPFMVDLFTLAAPAGAKILCYTEAKAIERWNHNQFGAGPIIVIFKTIEVAKRVHDNGVVYESLNIGQVPKTEERRVAYNTVHLSEKELDELISLQDEGVEVYFHPTPEDKRVILESVVKKMRG